MSKILIVEDNAESRYMLEQLLASKGHNLIAAENGEDALRFARQDPPEVIISDIMMPVMNGFRLCREVKKDAGLRNIPFIFYTATFVEKADEKLAMSLGASRFIVKPTEGERFIQILDEVLSEHRKGILPVPERPLEAEDTLLEMYDNSIARKLAETVEKLQDERRALIKSEQRLKEAQELARIGHWELDVKSNSLECSDEIYRILGLKPQEFDASYEAFMAFVHPDDRAYVAKARKASLEKKTQHDIEYRVLLKDGRVRYANERFQTIYDDDGMPTCSMGTVQDITGRKRAEARLEQLSNVLRAIRGVNQLIVREKNRDRLIQRACEILISARYYHNAWIAMIDESGGLVKTAEAGLGKEFLPLLKRLEKGELVTCAQRSLKKSGVVFIGDPSTACADCPLAKESHARGAMAVRLEHGGKVYGLLSISIPKELVKDKEELSLFEEVVGDIAFALHGMEVEAERKRAEQTLDAIFQSARDGILMTDAESGRFVVANDAICQMLGYSAEEIKGLSVADIHPAESLEYVRVQFDKQVRGEITLALDIPVKRKDGSVFLTDVNSAPLELEGRHRLVGIFRDISERKRAEEGLRRERDFVSRIMETSPVCITMVNREGQITFVNPGAEEVLGLSPDEMTGRAFNSPEWSITDFDGKPFPEEQLPFRRVMDTGLPVYDAHHAIEWPDGRRVLLSINGAPLFDNVGQIEGVICALQNMTEQIETSKALRESEEHYRTLFEQSKDAIYLTTREGKFIDVNQAFLDLFGYAKAEITSLNSEEIYVDPNDRLRFKQQVEKAGFLKDFDVTLRKSDGTEIDCVLTSAIQKAEDGSILGYQGFVWDITERKEAEKKIKEYADNLESMVEKRTKELNRALYDTEESRDKIDGILKSIADGLIVTDLYNRVILMNRTAEDLLGVRLSEVINRPIDFAIEDKTLRDQIKTTLSKKETGYQFDFELPGDNSTHPRIIRARTSIIEDKIGTEKGIITTIHDVTYEREVDRMKTEFISTAAHELRTPLTSILGFSEVLLNQDNLPTEEKTEFLGYINTQSKSLSKIIDDLLDISRIESGRGFSMSKEPCDPLEITRKVISYYEKQSPKHQFEVMFPKRPVEIMADRDKMEQAIKNLIDNAVKYSPAGATIRINGKRAGDYYRVSIKDQGVGMTREQVERIFDKFYRSEEAQSLGKGTGLGMSIVKNIIELHDGKVYVESEHGKGTTVSFTIPV